MIFLRAVHDFITSGEIKKGKVTIKFRYLNLNKI
jgi:hypothetical protein